MKKIMIALAVLGIANCSAQAQEKSKYDKNYSICRHEKGYAVCKPGELPGPAPVIKKTEEVLPEKNRVIYIRCQSALDPQPATINTRRHHIIVSYEDNMNNPYHGLPSQQYDGPEKNKQRNLNENQTSMKLPSNMGTNSENLGYTSR